MEFQAVHETFRPRIYRYLIRLVGEQEAEDLTQEVFVRVDQALGTFRGESQLSTWIYRIATNAALDRMRSPSYRRIEQIHLPDDPIDQSELEVEDRNTWTGERTPSLEQQLVRKEMNECIQSFIETLPGDYRTVLVLSDMEGLSDKDIAEILQVSLSTVKIRLHRARRALKEDLERRCDSVWVEENEFLPNLRGILGANRKTD